MIAVRRTGQRGAWPGETGGDSLALDPLSPPATRRATAPFRAVTLFDPW
jgi:hypothetical protein